MNKKGFTLIELLGVVILITLISFLVFPSILNKIKESKKTIDSATEKLLINAAKLYVSDNPNEYSSDYSYEACIDIQKLIDKDYLEPELLEEYSTSLTNKAIKVIHVSSFDYDIVNDEKCVYEEDITDASSPELNGLTPVVYDGNSWVVADTTKPWYSYSMKKWANAVLLYKGVEKGVGDAIDLNTDVVGMYVWIPRYRYNVTNANLKDTNIIFENKSTSNQADTTSDFRVHPAFTFGNVDLNGIWVGKFETSGGNSPIILPNKSSSVSLSMKAQFDNAKLFSSYADKDMDIHMMKNSEWGAVAYLTNSIYGINGEIRMNNTFPIITGCAGNTSNVSSICENEYNTEIGVLSSTTGNIYGIYDMSGGSYEVVMSSYNNNVGLSGFETNFFTNSDNAKYFDNLNSNVCNIGYCIEIPTFDSNNPFIIRGGDSNLSNSNIITTGVYSGSGSQNIGYRVVMAKVQ